MFQEGFLKSALWTGFRSEKEHRNLERGLNQQPVLKHQDKSQRAMAQGNKREDCSAPDQLMRELTGRINIYALVILGDLIPKLATRTV